MHRGVDRRAFARGWGRTGAVAALVLAGCASAPGRHLVVSSTSGGRVAEPPGAERLIVPPTDPVTLAPPELPGSPPVPGNGGKAGSGATGTGVWSVVIGVDDYPGSGHDLAFARNDAADITAVLVRAGEAPEQRRVLLDGQASASAIRGALGWLVAHAGPSSTAVVYYAGHVRKLGPTTEAFVGADDQVVTDREVAQLLVPLRAARTWVVVAGCYGGGFTEVLAPGRILTAAAPANSLAYETATYHRSYLGEYLVHRGMLEGLGGPTVQSAFAYAYAALHHEHPGREPVELDDGGGPLVLDPAAGGRSTTSTTSTTSAASPRSPASSTTTTTPPSGGSPQSCLITTGYLAGCTSRTD
jgi:hypothetical protein